MTKSLTSDTHTYTNYACFRFIPRQDIRTMFCDSHYIRRLQVLLKYVQLSAEVLLARTCQWAWLPLPLPRSQSSLSKPLGAKDWENRIVHCGLTRPWRPWQVLRKPLDAVVSSSVKCKTCNLLMAKGGVCVRSPQRSHYHAAVAEQAGRDRMAWIRGPVNSWCSIVFSFKVMETHRLWLHRRSLFFQTLCTGLSLGSPRNQAYRMPTTDESSSETPRVAEAGGERHLKEDLRVYCGRASKKHLFQ